MLVKRSFFRLMIIIVTLTIVCIGLYSTAYATESILGEYSNVTPNLGEGKGDIEPTVNVVLGYIQFIGYAIALGMIIYIGIKYMMSAAQDRASLKKGAFAYIFGAILLAGATTILPIIIGVGTGKNSNNMPNTSGVPSIGYRAEFEATGLPESNYSQWLKIHYGIE